ncbi:MAG: preprotein translocase subunit SecE [Butyricicoccus pullicaecorum]|nr:preprotein translocase subunit SecE [Butyricicoccus pullicaecorum]
MAEQEKNVPAEKKAEKPAKAKKPSIFVRIGKWFRELKGECKKIVWPTRQQTTNNTAVVLATCLIIGVFIWVLDAVFQFGVSALIR